MAPQFSSKSEFSSSSEEEFENDPMHLRPAELLEMAKRRERRLFKTKKDLRRIVLNDTLIDRLKIHIKECKIARINRKRRFEEEMVGEQKKIKTGFENSENCMDLRARLGQMDLLTIIGARKS